MRKPLTLQSAPTLINDGAAALPCPPVGSSVEPEPSVARAQRPP